MLLRPAVNLSCKINGGFIFFYTHGFISAGIACLNCVIRQYLPLFNGVRNLYPGFFYQLKKKTNTVRPGKGDTMRYAKRFQRLFSSLLSIETEVFKQYLLSCRRFFCMMKAASGTGQPLQCQFTVFFINYPAVLIRLFVNPFDTFPNGRLITSGKPDIKITTLLRLYPL